MAAGGQPRPNRLGISTLRTKFFQQFLDFLGKASFNLSMKQPLEFSFTNTFGGAVMVHGQTPDLKPLVGENGPSSGIIAFVDFRGGSGPEFEWANDIHTVKAYELPAKDAILAKLSTLRK
jgi:hypothetical protein